MSQHALERTLGKLATDEEFRARFFEALSGLSPAAIARFSQSLDDRIRRLCLARTPPRTAPTQQGLSRGRFDAGAENA